MQATTSLMPYTARESFSRYVIITDATQITVRSLTDLVSFSGGYNSTGLLVNGVPQGNGSQLSATGTTTDTVYSLPPGTNTLELIDGPCGETAVNAPPIRYTPVLSYWLPHGSSHSVVVPSAPANRIVDLGDSLTQGAFPDAGPNQASVYQAFTMLMRANALASSSGTFAGAHVFVAGSGGRQLEEECGTAGAITASIARLQRQLDGTSANLLIFAMQVNDWGQGVTAATMQTHAGSWVDAVHAQFPALKIVLQSMLIGVSEVGANSGGSTKPQCRTALSNVAAARAPYCFYIDGLTLVPNNSAAYFAADKIHLTTLGMSTVEANRRAALNALGLGY